MYYVYKDNNSNFLTAVGFNTQNISPPDTITCNSTIYNEITSNGIIGWTYSGNDIFYPTDVSILNWNKQQNINSLKNDCTNSIYSGFNITINGVHTTITLKEDNNTHDQTNALMASMAAQGAMQKSGMWTANTTYYTNSVIVSNSTYYVAFTSGTSGNTQPTFPTEFSVTIQDGTIQWYKMGFRISTANGVIIVDPPTAVSLFEQGLFFVNSQREKYGILKSQVMSANTVNDVNMITW